MIFINPIALTWGLLAVVLVAFYLWNIRPARQPVSTDFFWRQVLGRSRLRSAWRPWRRPVSLAIQLAILLLIVLALAEPPIWQYLGGAALALAAVEWCLFQRRSTC